MRASYNQLSTLLTLQNQAGQAKHNLTHCTSSIYAACREVWRKQSCDRLARKFPNGLDFRVLTPRFNTLEQQTMQRVVQAKLVKVSLLALQCCL